MTYILFDLGLKEETKELDSKSNIKETSEAIDMGSTNPSSVANSGDGFDDDSSKGGNSNHRWFHEKKNLS